MRPPIQQLVSKINKKVILVTGRRGPSDSETSKLQQFSGNRLTDGGEIFTLTRQAIAVTDPGGP
jgi:hypothetical protein